MNKRGVNIDPIGDCVSLSTQYNFSLSVAIDRLWYMCLLFAFLFSISSFLDTHKEAVIIYLFAPIYLLSFAYNIWLLNGTPIIVSNDSLKYPIPFISGACFRKKYASILIEDIVSTNMEYIGGYILVVKYNSCDKVKKYTFIYIDAYSMGVDIERRIANSRKSMEKEGE